MKPADRRAIHLWMERLAEGDRKAFDPLFVALWPIALRFSERVLGSGDGADAAQSALAKVFSHAHDFDAERDAVAWVLGIVAWECRTFRRRRERRHETAELVDPIDDQTGESIIRRDLERAFVEAVEELNTADREVIAAILRDERVDDRGPTYRKRLSRALARLRQIWRSKHDPDI